MPRKKKSESNLPSISNPHGFGIEGISEPTGFAANIPSGGTLGITEEEMGRYSHITMDPTLSESQKRRRLLAEMGITKTRAKYANAAERQAAAEARKAKKKIEKEAALLEAGLSPRKKKTEAEKRQTGKARGLKKRDFVRLMGRAVPKTAEYYGIDVGKARKASDIDVEAVQELMYLELKKKFEK